MVNRIGPNPLETKVITPHLHKHWHLISEMPDLNDEEQEKHEKKIYKALLLGFLYDFIRFETVGNKQEKIGEKGKKVDDIVRYKLWLKGGKSDTPLVTSNETPCDTFYEIVDALTINPVIVNDLLNAIEKLMETERRNNIVNFRNGALFKGLDTLELKEISGDNRNMSIFAIAMAYKVTMPPDLFIAEQGQLLMETTMETLYDQVNRLCPENERDSTYIDLIDDQFKRFKQNINIYETKYPSAIKDYLRQLLHTAMNFLHEKGFTEIEKQIDQYSKDYFSGNLKTGLKNTPPGKDVENKEE
jgi:hypothetical protein